MAKHSDKHWSLKNRCIDLAGKMLSVKMIWGIIVTTVFLASDKVSAVEWLTFIGGVVLANTIDKIVYNNRNNSSRSTIETVETKVSNTVGAEPDA